MEVLQQTVKQDRSIEKIIELREYIHQNDLWDRPEALSEVMTKLAVRNHQLAEHIARLEKTYKESEILEYQKARKSLTQGDAEKQARLKSLDAKEDYENVKTVNKATADLINVIQSRLRILTEQARGTQ